MPSLEIEAQIRVEVILDENPKGRLMPHIVGKDLTHVEISNVDIPDQYRARLNRDEYLYIPLLFTISGSVVLGRDEYYDQHIGMWIPKDPDQMTYFRIELSGRDVTNKVSENVFEICQDRLYTAHDEEDLKSRFKAFDDLRG